MATKIQVRRDTATDWTSTNPTLAAGEIGFESDTNKFKIGDGATAWTSLNYAPEGYATTSYVDTQDANIASDTLTFTNKTFDANGTGNSISNIETADFATAAFKDEDTMSSNSDTAVASQQSIKAYVDAEDANIASDTLTFTNKTFDANGTGNSISNIETADIAAGTLVTAAEGIGSNNNDTTIPTSAAVKAYADSVGGGGASLGDLTATGSTLTAPSNGTLALETSGTGRVVLAANNGDYESKLSSTRYNNSNNMFYHDPSASTNTGVQVYGNTMYTDVTLTASQADSTNSNDRWMNQNLTRLDMNGNNSTSTSATYRSRGPNALKNYTTILNGGASSSSLGNAMASLNGIYTYTNNQDLTVSAATGVMAMLETEIDGTGNVTYTDFRGFHSGGDVYGSTGTRTVTDYYHYYCAAPGGTITNQYAFYDATNSLSVFGDIQTQAVSITDNLIKSNRSNDNLNFQTNGTGRFQFGDSQTFNIDWQSLYGADNRVTDFAFIKEESKDANTSGFEYMAGFHHDVQLTGSSTTNSSFRPRGLLSLTTLDHAGYSYTRAGLFRGPLGAAFGALSMNSSTTAASLANNRGLEISHGAYTFNSATAQGDVTITDSTGCMAISYSANDDTGTGADFNVTNAYAFRSGYYVFGNASSMTNHYGYYYHGDEYGGGTQPTNIYAFYDNANKLSRFGAVILANQAGDPSGVADSAHIYAKDVTASSEVFVRDEAGNVTQISPHNEAGEWQYWSENIKTGKKVRVNMERMIRKLEEITGETFIENE